MNMNVLVLYDQYWTFTNTILDHLSAFGRHSRFKHVYCHGQNPYPRIEWDRIHAIVIHYSLRVAFKQIPEALTTRIQEFAGPKILFVQDEYDLTENTRAAIEQLEVNVVFTCVPPAYRESVYPSARFPRVRFVTTLTGYMPLHVGELKNVPSIRERNVSIAYRGRALPYFYGDLGQEKLTIAQRMRQACQDRRIASDIEWSEDKRIYGPAWPEFLVSAKATLGTESGCNLFDDDGQLRSAVAAYLREHPDASYEEVKQRVLGNRSEKPIMNQISPRFFEAIYFKTALVLFEGTYSGILKPWRHYVPLRKDFANLDTVFQHVRDDEFLQEMVDRTYADIVESGQYTYAQFIREYDAVLDDLDLCVDPTDFGKNFYGADVTQTPVRSLPVPPVPRWISTLWNLMPAAVRNRLQHQAVKLWMRLKT